MNDLYSTLSFGAVMNTLGKKLKIMRDFRRRCAFDFFLACCISLASSSSFFLKGFALEIHYEVPVIWYLLPPVGSIL